MSEVSLAAISAKASASDDALAFRRQVLAKIHAGGVQLALMKIERKSIYTALNGNFITAGEAVEWLIEFGAMRFVENAVECVRQAQPVEEG